MLSLVIHVSLATCRVVGSSDTAWAGAKSMYLVKEGEGGRGGGGGEGRRVGERRKAAGREGGRERK